LLENYGFLTLGEENVDIVNLICSIFGLDQVDGGGRFEGKASDLGDSIVREVEFILLELKGIT